MSIRRAHNILLALLIGSVLTFPAAAVAESGALLEQTGKHAGEERFLEYAIEYLDPKGVTSVDATGITYEPFTGGSSHEDTILPERYYGGYALYFFGDTLTFRVHLINTGKRSYRNLRVVAVQELLNSDGGTGEAFGEPEANVWYVEELGGGEEVVLEGTVKIVGGEAGIDQTHLQILHWDPSGAGAQGLGRVIVDDPQAGLWCPSVVE